MKFELRQSPAKEESIYKTLYIKRSLADHIEEIASENSTSFNNVVISMIESCLKEEQRTALTGGPLLVQAFIQAFSSAGCAAARESVRPGR